MFQNHLMTLTVMGFSPDGTRLFAGTSGNNSVLVWDVQTEPLSLKLAHHIKGHSRAITGGSFAKGSNQFHSVSLDGKYKVWDLDRSEPYVNLDSISDVIRIGYAEGNQKLLINDRRGGVYGWNLDPRQKPQPLFLPNGFRARAFSEEGILYAGRRAKANKPCKHTHFSMVTFIS